MTMSDSDPPKPKRRWYQYSLRTLLIFVTVVAVFCSWFAVRMQRAKRQREAVEAIAKTATRVRYDYHARLSQGAKPPDPLRLRKLLGDDFFSDVVVVGLKSDAGDAELEYFQRLTELRSLGLSDTQITDAGLEHLKGMTSLKWLNLARTQVSDAGLEHLKGLTSLETLWLTRTQVTDAGLEHLEGLTSLQELELDQTQVTDAGLVHLKGLSASIVSHVP